MKRSRASTLMPLIAMAALLLMVVIQRRRIARLESDRKSSDDVITELRMDEARGWLAREGQAKKLRPRRVATPIAASRHRSRG